MAFLKGLFSRNPQATQRDLRGPITSWPTDSLEGRFDIVTFDAEGRNIVDVVGEGSYQGTIERIGGGRTPDGALYRDHLALLLPEPGNPYDRNAVRVMLRPADGGTAGKVGYLSREDAVAYRPVIDRLAGTGKLASAAATISGGWDRGGVDRGSFGVRIHLGPPTELMRELDELDPPA